MDVANLLKLDIPFCKFFGGQVKSLALVSNVLAQHQYSSFGVVDMTSPYMILAENTAKIAPGEEN
jgi:hypothetical protein